MVTSSNKIGRFYQTLSNYIYTYIYKQYNFNFFVAAMFAIICITVLPSKAKAQYDLPVITNERGDTIQYVWPLPDSALCIKDEIIIKFKPNALFIEKLCFNFTIGPPVIQDSSDD